MLAADPIKLDFWPQLVKLFSAILITMILVRGGVQESPLRASSAIVADDGLINHIALNPVFTTVMDLKGRSVPTHLRMDPNEAIQIIQKISKYENTEFLNDANFPLLRKQMETNRGKVPNIVLIFLESWTAKFTKPIGQGEIAGKEITPNFNALAKEGQLFTNFYANGGRTSNGLMSVITGIPDRPGLTAVRSPQIMGNFSSLGRIFSKWGYETIFITGDDLQFDNLETLLPHWGFQRRIGKKEIQETGKYTLGAWGYDDETIYDLLLKEMEKTHKNGSPFLASALTMTTHYPYKVPNPKFEIFSKEINDYDYLNTYHYADWALGAFLEKAKKYPFFKDTIFIFVGDHTHHRTLNYYEDRNVPLLLYGPRFIDKKLNSTVSSQIDVLPTMLGLVGKETNFSAVGRNLLAKGIGSGWAYFAYGVAYGWIEGDQFLYQWVDGDKSLQFRAKEPFTEHEACKKDPFPCKESLRKGNAIFNITIELMNQNRIFPQEN
ncbi:arylesterase [Leptospira ryugenii]|uniref:Arylesterase n=2 Tax=Leptospira ryugenii TaxID=1917863 RepID=A0A2P2E005_9LEPT|nr:arylesterase [Leptospira ryugenii]